MKLKGNHVYFNLLYGLYKGDEFIDVGTIEELAERLKLKPATIQFMGTEIYKKRYPDNGKHYVVVKLYERKRDGEIFYPDELTDDGKFDSKKKETDAQFKARIRKEIKQDGTLQKNRKGRRKTYKDALKGNN